MSPEPESLILHLLREMRADMEGMRSEMQSLRSDVAADFIGVRKEITEVRRDLGDQIIGLRRTLVDYHGSVVGHGVLISDLEARVRRVEQHLNLPAMDAH